MNKKNIKIFLIIGFIALAACCCGAQLVHAGGLEASTVALENPLGDTFTFQDLAKKIITWIRDIALAISVIMIVWAGILFMTAAGNVNKITQARQALIWSLVGLAIVIIGSGWIAFIQGVLSH